MRHSVLIVDDYFPLLVSLRYILDDEYVVDTAETGQAAFDKIAGKRYHCMLLDMQLPDMSGADICRKLRHQGNDLPIIVLSGEGKPEQKADMLNAGADDYITKPADKAELRARLKSVIRRHYAQRQPGVSLVAGGVKLDSTNRIVERNGVRLNLRPKEFSLLECLMDNAGRPVPRAKLVHYAWQGAGYSGNGVDVHIKYLRDKLDLPFGTPLIHTVHRIGYKFEDLTERS